MCRQDEAGTVWHTAGVAFPLIGFVHRLSRRGWKVAGDRADALCRQHPWSTLHTSACTQVASLTMLLQLERDEAANWRVKWAEEATKTDGVKRECMQVLYSYYDRSACRVWAS